MQVLGKLRHAQDDAPGHEANGIVAGSPRPAYRPFAEAQVAIERIPSGLALGSNGRADYDSPDSWRIEFKPRPRTLVHPRPMGVAMERETRFELATPALARRCSTTELLPHGS